MFMHKEAKFTWAALMHILPYAVIYCSFILRMRNDEHNFLY